MRWIWVVLAIFLMGTASFAKEKNRHFDLFLGYIPDDELVVAHVGFDTTHTGSIGARLMKSDVILPKWDVGLAASRMKMDYADASPNTLTGTAIMAVAHRDIFTRKRFQVYFGGGLGAVHLNYDDAIGGYENGKIILGGEITLGMRMDVSPRMKLFAEARYLRSKDVRVVNNPANADATFHNRALVMGIRHSF